MAILKLGIRFGRRGHVISKSREAESLLCRNLRGEHLGHSNALRQKYVFSIPSKEASTDRA